MIEGDFYYENKTGLLYIFPPNNLNPNEENIEVGLYTYLNLNKQRYVKIKNLTIRYSSSKHPLTLQGNNNIIENLDVSYNSFIALAGYCHNCTIRNSKLNFNGNSAAGMFGNFTIYENNIIKGNNYRNFSMSWSCGGFKFIPNIYNMIIRDNVVRDNLCFGIWFDTMGGGHIIERNIITNNSGYGVMIEISNGTRENPIIIRNNIIYNNGIGTWWEGGVYISSSDYVYVLNNLFYNLPGGVIAKADPNNPDMRRKTLIGNKIINNIFLNVSFPIAIKREDGVLVKNNTADYNLFFNPDKTRMWRDMKEEWGLSEEKVREMESKMFWCDSWCSGSRKSFEEWRGLGFDLHSIIADPKLRNPSNYDFHLTENSPAIDSGINVRYVEKDIEGNYRDSNYDVGPYEFDSQMSNAQTENKVGKKERKTLFIYLIIIILSLIFLFLIIWLIIIIRKEVGGEVEVGENNNIQEEY